MVALRARRPGAPFVYGASPPTWTRAPGRGVRHPEYVKVCSRRPPDATDCRGAPNVNASPTVDAQAAYESGMSVWGAAMSGANLIYQGAGWLESGLTASFEKLIVDAEILQMISEVLQPLVVDDASLALDAIADVGPGGHFFGTAHTIERYEHAFYRPILSDWRNFETWQEDGAHSATERANGVWKQLLAEFEPPPLAPATAEAIDAFVERRKREIGAG